MLHGLGAHPGFISLIVVMKSLIDGKRIILSLIGRCEVFLKICFYAVRELSFRRWSLLLWWVFGGLKLSSKWTDRTENLLDPGIKAIHVSLICITPEFSGLRLSTGVVDLSEAPLADMRFLFVHFSLFSSEDFRKQYVLLFLFIRCSIILLFSSKSLVCRFESSTPSTGDDVVDSCSLFHSFCKFIPFCLIGYCSTASWEIWEDHWSFSLRQLCHFLRFWLLGYRVGGWIENLRLEITIRWSVQQSSASGKDLVIFNPSCIGLLWLRNPEYASVWSTGEVSWFCGGLEEGTLCSYPSRHFLHRVQIGGVSVPVSNPVFADGALPDTVIVTDAGVEAAKDDHYNFSWNGSDRSIERFVKCIFNFLWYITNFSDFHTNKRDHSVLVIIIHKLWTITFDFSVFMHYMYAFLNSLITTVFKN